LFFASISKARSIKVTSVSKLSPFIIPGLKYLLWTNALSYFPEALMLNKARKLDSSGSTLVEFMPQSPKVEGSRPVCDTAAGTLREREIVTRKDDKKFYNISISVSWLQF
jgi:hypothetical protein